MNTERKSDSGGETITFWKNYTFVLWNSMYESCKTRNMDQQVKRVGVISAYAGYYTTQCKIINISIYVVTDLVYCIWVQLLTVSNCRHGLRVYITSYSIKKWTNTCKEVLFSVFCSNIQKSQTVIIWAQYCFPNHFSIVRELQIIYVNDLHCLFLYEIN